MIYSFSKVVGSAPVNAKKYEHLQFPDDSKYALLGFTTKKWDHWPLQKLGPNMPSTKMTPREVHKVQKTMVFFSPEMSPLHYIPVIADLFKPVAPYSSLLAVPTSEVIR